MTDQPLDQPLNDHQKLRVASATLQVLDAMSKNPDEVPAREGDMSPAQAAQRAYQDHKDSLCREGIQAWEKASQNLLNEFSQVAGITDPYIERRQEKDLRDRIKTLGNDGKELNNHCATPTSSGTSSPKI